MKPEEKVKAIVTHRTGIYIGGVLCKTGETVEISKRFYDELFWLKRVGPCPAEEHKEEPEAEGRRGRKRGGTAE